MTARLGKNLQYFKEQGSSQPLLRAIEKSVRRNIWLAFTLQIAFLCIDYASIVPFYFLWQFLKDSRGDNAPSYARGIIWIVLICVSQGLVAINIAHSKYQSDMSGAEIRTALVCLVSNKSFTIDKHASTADVDQNMRQIKDKHNKDNDIVTDVSPANLGDTGTAFALMTVEAERAGDLLGNAIIVIRCFGNWPIVAGLTGWLMGWVAAPLIVILGFFQIIAIFFLAPGMRARVQANKLSAQRTTELNNFFMGIRLIKYVD